MKKLLLVDDDKEFLNFLTAQASNELDIIVSRTFTAAREFIRRGQFDGFLVDGFLADGSGLDLVQEIRQVHGNSIPVAFISAGYTDTDSFRILKTDYRVDYVLNKPVSPGAIRDLFSAVCGTAKSNEGEFDLSDLRAEYQKTIITKISTIDSYIEAYRSQPGYGTMKTLKAEVHRVAGSAGTYGYARVSRICKAMDERLEQALLTNNAIDETDLRQFLQNVKYSFQIPDGTEGAEEPETVVGPLTVAPFLFDGEPQHLLIMEWVSSSAADPLPVVKAMTDASAFWRNTPLIRWNMNRFLALFTYERNLLAEAVQSQLKKFRNETMEQGLDGDWDFTLRTTPDDGTSLSDLLIERKPESPVRQVVENEVRVEPVRHRPERKQIVLVDDDTDLTSLLRYAFTQRNYLVTTAASGTEAIRLLSQLQKPPSLMVLDRELPDMDGIELLRHIPESVTLNSPLIFLSSKDNKADILRGLKAGAREYVTKPFSIDVFLEKAIRLLNP